MLNFFKKNPLTERLKRVEKDIEDLKNKIALVNNYITLLATKPPAAQSPLPYKDLSKCSECNYALDSFMCSNPNCPHSVKNIF